MLSLKSNPFVLLVGKSGCGKSALPRLFSDYLSVMEKHEDIIIESTNLLGKAYSNKEWHLKRKVISDVLPILPFEGKECLFTINDSFSSAGRLTLDPRFKFNDKRLINHLLKLHDEDPHQDVNLKIKIGEKSVDSLFLKIVDFKNEIQIFNKFVSGVDDNSSKISKFLYRSRKNSSGKYFIIIENIDSTDEKELNRFFEYIHDEFNLLGYNNLFVVCTLNIDEFNPNFSNSFFDRVNVIEMNNGGVFEYLADSFDKFPEFGDINYLEFDSENMLNLSAFELRPIFDEIFCGENDLWSLISQEFIKFNNIFLKEGLNLSFRTINDILRFLLASWKYDGKQQDWVNWEKYFDIQINQRLLPKIKNHPKNLDFFNELSEACLKSEDDGLIIDNIKYPSSYLKIKNMESSLDLTNFSFFNSYSFIKDISTIETSLDMINNKGKKPTDKNTSRYGSNIYKSGDYFLVNKQIKRKNVNFGKFDTLNDATFIKSILVENEWVLSRIKNTECIYENNGQFWVIKVFKSKLHILGKFNSYNQAEEHVDWLTNEFKNNKNFTTYVPKYEDNSTSDDSAVDDSESDNFISDNSTSDDSAVDDSESDNFTSDNLDEKIDKITGWEKLVFDAINEIESDIFSLDDLKRLDVFKIYQFEDESLELTIIENLNKLENLNLIKMLSNNYYKKVF